MALDPERLKAKIKEAYDAVSDKEIDPAQAREQLANTIANAIVDEIRLLEVVVSGIVTSGSPTTQTQTIPVKATVS